MAWGFQKHSPYLQLFNYHLKRLEEQGSFKKFWLKNQPQIQVCPDGAGKPIGFESCLTAFLAFAGKYEPVYYTYLNFLFYKQLLQYTKYKIYTF